MGEAMLTSGQLFKNLCFVAPNGLLHVDFPPTAGRGSLRWMSSGDCGASATAARALDRRALRPSKLERRRGNQEVAVKSIISLVEMS